MYDYISIRSDAKHSRKLRAEDFMALIESKLSSLKRESLARFSFAVGNYKCTVQAILADENGNYGFDSDAAFDDINLIEINIPQGAEDIFRSEILDIAFKISSLLNWEIYDHETGGLLQDPTLPDYVAEFEALIGAALPADYRQFLLDTGGNTSFPQIVEVSCGKPGDLTVEIGFQIVELEHLASVIPNASGVSELSRHYRYMSGPERANNWLPDDMIVIGNSGGGGRCFLIAINGPRYGQVFFWDINLFPQDDNVPANYDNISFAATSFNAFMEGIKEHDA